LWTWFIASLLLQWLLKTWLYEQDRTPSTQLRLWFIFEEVMFLGQVLFGIVFLGVAYTCKFKSIWSDSKPVYRKLNARKVAVDVWSKKSSSDFLHYLKFEYM
jgi:hypothetical protein